MYPNYGSFQIGRADVSTFHLIVMQCQIVLKKPSSVQKSTICYRNHNQLFPDIRNQP